MDLEAEDHTEGTDIIPGSDTGEDTERAAKDRRRLLEMARKAEKLVGEQDAKTSQGGGAGQRLRPILFCRFIPTAEYVAEQLRLRLPKDVQVAAYQSLTPRGAKTSGFALLLSTFVFLRRKTILRKILGRPDFSRRISGGGEGILVGSF